LSYARHNRGDDFGAADNARQLYREVAAERGPGRQRSGLPPLLAADWRDETVAAARDVGMKRLLTACRRRSSSATTYATAAPADEHLIDAYFAPLAGLKLRPEPSSISASFTATTSQGASPFSKGKRSIPGQ
jgi:hypothetical protein